MKNNVIFSIGFILCFLFMAGKAYAQTVSTSVSSLEWEASSTAAKSFMVYSSSPWQMDTASVSGHFSIVPMMGAGNTQVQVTPNTQNESTEDILHLISIEGINGGGVMVYLTHYCSASPGGNGSGGNNPGGNGNGSGITVWPTTLEWPSHDIGAKLATITLANGGIWDTDTSYMSSPFSLSAATGVSGDGIYVAPKTINHSTEDVTDCFFFEGRSGGGSVVLNLVQHGVVYSIETSPQEIIWEADSLSDCTVTITALGDWTASVSGQGFTITGGSGLDNGSFTVHPTGLYYGRGNRTATLTVSCHGISRTINLVQKRSDQSLGIAGNWMLKRSQYAIGGNAYNEDIVFYNGLGYAEQTVMVGASPQQSKNIVTPIVYDAMMRADARTYLPYVSTGTTATEVAPATALANQAAWYGDRYNGEGQYANAVQVYEASPLGRVISSHKPGLAYASGEKRTEFGYDTNTVGEVLKLSVNSSGGLEVDGWYAAGTLYKETMTDEDSVTVSTFTDKHGRTVLSREGGNDTYMAYDSRGFLAWVVSPEGSALLASNTVWSKPAPGDINTGPSARYCYIYENNGFGWPVWRKQPGRAVEYFGYDSAGRVVRSQDGVLRAKGNKWLIYKYDALGREVCRGVSSETSALEEVVDTVLARTFYGSYSGLDSSLGFRAPDYGLIMISADMSHIRGLKTREMVWVLGGSANDYMERAYYYDSDGRLCQRVEKYPDGNIVRTSLAYDFAGDITARCEEHLCTDGAEHLYYTEYTYDHRGRMTGMTRSFEGEQLASVSYSYDALGRPERKIITSDTPSGPKTGLESMGYDIRGWSTGSSALYCGTQLFGETLRYTSTTKPGVAARWNGNISEAAYFSPTGEHTFGYAYDPHNRLSGTRHFIGNSTSESNDMSEKDITYDRNGNMTGLKRYMTNGMQDELVFTHAGNLVTQWTDVYNSDNGYYGYDGNGNRIQDGHSNLDYSYNILNLPASVTNVMNQSVTYKYLADGTKISALSEEGEGKEYRGTFIYDRHSAEGSDWSELGSIAWEEGRIVVKPGNDMVDSLAVDSLYVEDFPIEGEEIVVDSTAVVPFYLHDLWYVKDHLGSVRSVVLLGEDYTGAAAVVEQNGYYPFGTRIAGTAGAAADSLDYANRYRFCGKEEQDFSPSLNLELLDFGARYYDPFTCRWTTQDPFAEKYYGLSPYSYCANNPVTLIDPTGEQWYSYVDENGETQYVYYEGEMPKEERKQYDKIQDLGYTYHDKNSNKYYSLFGNVVSINSDEGNQTLEYFLYQHIDDLIIKTYTSDDGFATENFFSGIRIGDYPFSYNGKEFYSKEGTIFRAVNNVHNSKLHIRQMPPKEERRLGGYMGAPSWYGSFMILSNDKRFDAVQVNYSKENAHKLHQAIHKLFK